MQLGADVHELFFGYSNSLVSIGAFDLTTVVLQDESTGVAGCVADVGGGSGDGGAAAAAAGASAAAIGGGVVGGLAGAALFAAGAAWAWKAFGPAQQLRASAKAGQMTANPVVKSGGVSQPPRGGRSMRGVSVMLTLALVLAAPQASEGEPAAAAVAVALTSNGAASIVPALLGLAIALFVTLAQCL